VAARIHPSKAKAFLFLLDAPDAPAGICRDVALPVNGPDGLVARSFADVAACTRELVATGRCAGVASTTTLDGFDTGDEPVLRELDGASTCLLLFAALPPFITESDPAHAARFDLEKFGVEIGRCVGAPCAWDDRDVFVISAPAARVAPLLRAFLARYWESPSGDV
jgi:hypothetical protein